MGKEKKETLDHKTHNKILTYMAVQEYDNESESYSKDIAGKLNCNRANIDKHLDVLEEKGYVILNKETQHKNKKLYSINWLKLSYDFFDFIKRETKGFAYKDFSLLNKRSLVRNFYFIELIKSSFYDNFRRYGNDVKTINEIFKEIFMQMIFYVPLDGDINMDDLSKKDVDAKEIMIFSRMIKNYIIENQSNSLDEFYTRIELKAKHMKEQTPTRKSIKSSTKKI
ncbi:MAG: winged helix-turn-helix domain-containing protein [Nanoarchaeota archaeon]|nr:winged helix-turn-helix domain-containing protein [Nanoarchaeota archaeon]